MEPKKLLPQAPLYVAFGGRQKMTNFFFNRKKKVGETDPIVKPSELSNMFPLKSTQKKLVPTAHE